jgi:antitoxin PrlF
MSMIEITAKISSKNQITLPADVRRRLRLGASDRVAFVFGENDTVELRPVKYDLDSIIGIRKPLPNESIDFDREIEEATEEEIMRRARHRA